MSLPGLKVGPLDPDATSGFGQIGQGNIARTVIRHHAAMYPPDLRRALNMKLDGDRTSALDQDEVRQVVADAGALPEGCTFEHGQVRGERGRKQIVTFTFLKPSGRVGKGYVDYLADSFPRSVERGDAAVHFAERKDAGLPFDTAGLQLETLRRELAEQRQRNDELSRELERLANEGASAGGRDPEPGAADHGPPQPIDGYDDLKADEVVELLRADETSDEDRRAILDYERGGKNRSTVIGAAEQSLGAGDPAVGDGESVSSG